MSAIRWKTLPPYRQDRYGYYLCRLCQNPCPGTQKQWCSEECFRRFLIMSHGSVVRALIYERDHGICAACGIDAAQMDEALFELQKDLLHPLLMTIHPMIVTTLRAEGWSNAKLRGRGSYPDAIKFSSCWEADHINPVIAGGGECSLENYRTLCFVCHKKVSAQQAKERARCRHLKKNHAVSTTSAPLPILLPADDEIPF